VLVQLLIGSALISLTIVISAIFIGAAVATLRKFGPWVARGRSVPKLVVATTTITLWMLAALSVCIWFWAGAFVMLGIFDTLEPALYFAFVSFTTLGFGDIILPQQWRLLSGYIAANGLILFSLTTAFLIQAIRRLQDENGDGD